MAKLVVTKTDAARWQLSAAIRMLFSKEDPVAIHTVVSAGFRIVRDLVKHRQIGNEQLIESIIKPGMQRAFWNVFSGPANFFKHADKDPENVLENVDEEVNDFVLFIAISYYEALREQKTLEMAAYQFWFMVSYPSFFPPELLGVFRMTGLADFSVMTREQRLEQGPLVLETTRQLPHAQPAD